jgi:hypothetical protein
VNNISDTGIGRQWVFRCDGANGKPQWRWECRGSDGASTAASLESFQSLRAAIENARQHGFPG